MLLVSVWIGLHSPDIVETRTAEYQTFGSEAILNNCWSPEQLRGTTLDKKVYRPTSYPYPNGPKRKFPKNVMSPLYPDLRNSIRYVKPYGDRKIVALTFDLCERAKEKTGYDAAIVNYLRENKVRATFFAGGKWMASHPEKTKQLMADPLFEIGNHGWTHGNLRVMTGEIMKEQVTWTQARYELLWEEFSQEQCAREAGADAMKQIPKIPLTFRFPYGTCSSEALRFLAESGLPAIQWDVVTGDPAKGQTAEKIARTVLSGTKSGSIIICHANGRGHGTAKSLPLFIPQLRKKGYEFVTISELLKSGEVIATEECFERKPGDNLRYDKIFGEGTQ